MPGDVTVPVRVPFFCGAGRLCWKEDNRDGFHSQPGLLQTPLEPSVREGQPNVRGVPDWSVSRSGGVEKSRR